MSFLVVDTDVASFFFKSDPRAKFYEGHLAQKTLALSFMSVAELYRWTLERAWGEKRIGRLNDYIATFVVQPFNQSLCWTWAQITDGRRRKGRPIDSKDAWIAATALFHRVPLVTHNRRDFEGIEGLSVLSEVTA